MRKLAFGQLDLLVEGDQRLYGFIMQFTRQPFALFLLAEGHGIDVAAQLLLVVAHLLGHPDQGEAQFLNFGHALHRLVKQSRVAPAGLYGRRVEAAQRPDQVAQAKVGRQA